jgi:hypothetical protein
VDRSSRASSLRARIAAAVLVVQADSFNLSQIQTAIVAAITSNVELAEARGMCCCRRARRVYLEIRS